MPTNPYFLAKIGADTAENKQYFAEILPIGRRAVGAAPARIEETGSTRRASLSGDASSETGSATLAVPQRRRRSVAP